jgi:hypothetical protein
MSQHPSFTCDHCKERIEDPGTSVYPGDCPVVIYMVAGLAPGHPMVLGGKGAADVTDFAMPQIVRDLLSQPVARMEFCPECLSERLGLPMVDAKGKKVKPSQTAPSTASRKAKKQAV